MNKILGVDLGTNSIGLSVRNLDKGNELPTQLDFFTSIIFKSGVGVNKSGEYSYAAERTKFRSTRRLYQSRKYRIWATLKLLIEYGFCPLSIDDLEKWSKYDKTKGLKRQYPIDAKEFEQWVRLDFDGDGKPEYLSPYELRAELMKRKFDLDNQTDRYKIGRALYHIAQRRGFKSSKGETLKEQELAETENNVRMQEIDLSTELNRSEEKKSKDLVEYMNEYNLCTVGCALYHIEKQGVRVRNSNYQPIRKQYKEEIENIFLFQGIDKNSVFGKRILSEKKGEGTIFYKRPLRSQKGLVGQCTLEKGKARCPISHPEFEEFRAWCFINNIKFRKSSIDDWQLLSIDKKIKLFNDKFLRTSSSFKFGEIREWLKKEYCHEFSYIDKTINYKDNTNVSGCPISGRFKNLLGNEWKTMIIETSKERVNQKTGELHRVSYDYNDLWHVCFSFDEAEYVEDFAKNTLNFDDKQAKQFVKIWGSIQQGYASLSLKAIQNINRFLRKGLIYTDSVLLAKLPDIFGDKWESEENNVILKIDEIITDNRYNKMIYNVVNSLIADYKSLGFDEEAGYNERFADHDVDYQLTETDKKVVEDMIIRALGEKGWEEKPIEEKSKICNDVIKLYQQFFSSSVRDYFKLPKLSESLARFLEEHYSFLQTKDLRKIYHPSMIDVYPASKETRLDDGRSLKLLGSPVIGAIKNPMAMRVLHVLRKQINKLIVDGVIDEETRIVVETARELNDANMRWAIEKYQREREKENEAFEAIINEHFPNRSLSNDDIDKTRLLFEQNDIQDITIEENRKRSKQKKNSFDSFKKDISKYKLWLEQGCRCIYTGRLINISSLFDENSVDFEHTIPRSISFDNSLSNLTVCDSHFNRTIKRNQIPSQLSNYDEILQRIQPWIDKVESLKDNVEFWKGQSKRAQDKTRKDYCIRQRHLWQLELDYWQKKVRTFIIKPDEITDGFRNNQLNDTRIITKYAYHYLKTVFNRVDVQKGTATADFRKIIGVQSVEEKKSRDKHSHHAIDATILTLIPVSAKRDRMIELFYKKEEARKLGNTTDVQRLDAKLRQEVRQCIPARSPEIKDFIENNILVNHISKDQSLTPAKRKARRRGKEIFVKDSNGELVNKWYTGDSIRGRLHKDSFFGAITHGEKNESGKLIRDKQGNILVGEKLYYVIRKELKYKKNDNDSGFKNWKEIEDAIVNKDLVNMMKGQFGNNEISFKDACEKGIFMLDKSGNKINKIRHIRCYSSVKNPLVIKNQTYISSKKYKNNYYADMGDLYVMCKYENEENTKSEYIILSLFEVSENRKNGLEDIPLTIMDKKGKQKLTLSHIIKQGDMLLLYQNSLEELKEMSIEALSKRLYVVRGFENDGNRIILQRHINAQSDKELGKGESIKSLTMPEKIRQAITGLNYLIKGKDFEISSNGNISFKN